MSSRLRVSDFLEQSHVLNRDHRLVGESVEQRHFLVIKGSAARRTTEMPPIAWSSRRRGARIAE
jgi:hypothetical protein